MQCLLLCTGFFELAVADDTCAAAAYCINPSPATCELIVVAVVMIENYGSGCCYCGGGGGDGAAAELLLLHCCYQCTTHVSSTKYFSQDRRMTASADSTNGISTTCSGFCNSNNTRTTHHKQHMMTHEGKSW